MKTCLRHAVACLAVTFATMPLSAQVEIVDAQTVALPWTQSLRMTLPGDIPARIDVTLPPPNVAKPVEGFPVLYYSGRVSPALMTDTMRRMGDSRAHAILVGVAPEVAGAEDRPIAPAVIAQFVRPELHRRYLEAGDRALYAAIGEGLDRIFPGDAPGVAAFDRWVFAHLDCPSVLAGVPRSLSIVRADCPGVSPSKAAIPRSSRLMLLEGHNDVTMVPESAVRAIALSLKPDPKKRR